MMSSLPLPSGGRMAVEQMCPTFLARGAASEGQNRASLQCTTQVRLCFQSQPQKARSGGEIVQDCEIT